MSRIDQLRSFYEGTRVLVTGHTGFKGAWLALALAELGASVTGVALAPEPDGVFELGGVSGLVRSHLADIRDQELINQVFQDADPEVVFHLAAQSLVPLSFQDPVGTFDVNVVGTAVVLAACDAMPSLRSLVIVTSDKVYENDGTGAPFVESDPLGAGDPYSTSKAAAELVVRSWRHSFSRTEHRRSHCIGSARAGNVIGGGDQAPGRVVPDTIRALVEGRTVELRNPSAVRPWQHVLEPVLGYLLYGESLSRAWSDPSRHAPTALNFGPDAACTTTVRELVDRIIDSWGEGSWSPTPSRPGPEAGTLLLDSSLAGQALGWKPTLGLDATIRLTIEWYRGMAEHLDCEDLSRRQLREYLAVADELDPGGLEQ